MEERLRLMLEQFKAAVLDFSGSLEIDLSKLEPVVADAVMNGRAQKFEFTIELCWKTLKIFLGYLHGFELASPKLVIKKWFELGCIDYDLCEDLLRALDIRNSLSHVYRKSMFLPLHDEIVRYGSKFSALVVSLEKQ